MRTFLNVSLEVVTALFFSASIGIGAGVAAISFTYRLGDGLKVRWLRSSPHVRASAMSSGGPIGR